MNEDKATRYHRRRRWVSALSALLSGALLVGLLVTSGTMGLRDLAHRVAAGFGTQSALVVVASYVVMLTAVHELIALPLSLYRHVVLDRRYGLSSQGALGWLGDHLKAVALGLVLAVLAGLTLYATLRAWPHRWWMASGLVFALAVVTLTHLGPVLLLPLFYRCQPLDRRALTTRLEALARRAGTSVLGVYEWRLGAKTRRANAALVGLFGPPRILLSDTLLAAYSEEEIEVVLAHELGHHVHGDIWKSVALESGVTVLGLFVAHRALASIGPMLGVRAAADVAGLPVILLAAGLSSLLFLPLVNGVSRRQERRADRYAVQLTGDVDAFVSALHRLEAQHLAEQRPSSLVRWLCYSHPPVAERIAAGEAQRASTTNSPCISLQRSSSARLQ